MATTQKTRLTEHFTLEEFINSPTSKALNIDNTPPVEYLNNIKYVAYLLELIRKRARVPIRISSGYRCPPLNKAVGGKIASRHLFGLAVDINQGSVGANLYLYSILSNLYDLFDMHELYIADDFTYIHISFNYLTF
ncbi:MAG: peptidase M15 [Bacteroidaceae bacterium]|nr:peptidase M15 [Bacteroidaceae bacterium]